MKKKFFLKIMLVISTVFTFANAKELKVVAPWEVTGMEPTQSGYIFSRVQVAETLVAVSKKGKLVPNLAKDWSVSKDALVWNFKIRKNVKFQDGTTLDANVVAFNLNRDATLKKSVLRYLPLKSIKANGDSVEITLSSQFSSLPAYLAHYSTIILAKKSFDKDGKVKSIIGTGAYKIKKISAPLSIKLTRNDKWWAGKANIKDVSYLAVEKGETRSLMIKSGEADIAYTLLPISLKSLRKNPNLNTTVLAISRTTLLKVNSGSPFLNTPELRQAISLAINRKGIAKAILKNKDLAATQMFPPSLKVWYNKDLNPLKMDIDKSKKLLEKAGWKLSNDGFRYKDGKKFEITLDTYPRPGLPVIATAIQAQLKEVGIDVKVLVGSYTEIIRKHKDNTLNLGLISRNFTLVPNPLGTLLQDYGKGGANWGAMNWENEKMFSYLDKLKKGDDIKLQHKITELLQNELPTIPVAWTEMSVVSNKKVKNLRVDPFEINYYLSDVSLSK